MCGIAGVSFSTNSSIDRRKITSALLSECERRGRDASGYAWVDSQGVSGMYKKAVAGSKLTTAMIPQDAQSIIIHTRASTHGHESNNDNNHPVLSPSGNLMLIHNGIIWNHEDVRDTLGEVGKKLPEVDSSVIPAVLEVLGIDGTDVLSGDAAVAWIDKETGGVIHLARFSNSPLHAATLIDGSTVFSSTPEILNAALAKLNLTWIGNWPDTFYKFAEGEYVQLFEGDVIASSTVEWAEDDYKYYGKADTWRKVTSGQTTTGSAQRDTAFSWEDDAYDRWDAPSGRAAALSFPALDTARQAEGTQDLFWATDHDGDTSTFASLAALTGYLSWHNEMTGDGHGLIEGNDPKTHEIRWVNHIGDIGEMDIESGEYVSWVSKPNEMDLYSTLLPLYVRDGADTLRKVLR